MLRQNDTDQQRRMSFEQALLSSGADSSQVDSIQEQIQKAIADAVKNGGSTNGRPDPSTIKNAVDGVLKANGLDVTKFQSSIEASRQASGAHHARHGHRKPQASEEQPTAIQFAPEDPTKGNQIDTAA